MVTLRVSLPHLLTPHAKHITALSKRQATRRCFQKRGKSNRLAQFGSVKRNGTWVPDNQGFLWRDADHGEVRFGLTFGRGVKLGQRVDYVMPERTLPAKLIETRFVNF